MNRILTARDLIRHMHEHFPRARCRGWKTSRKEIAVGVALSSNRAHESSGRLGFIPDTPLWIMRAYNRETAAALRRLTPEPAPATPSQRCREETKRLFR